MRLSIQCATFVRAQIRNQQSLIRWKKWMLFPNTDTKIQERLHRCRVILKRTNLVSCFNDDWTTGRKEHSQSTYCHAITMLYVIEILLARAHDSSRLPDASSRAPDPLPSMATGALREYSRLELDARCEMQINISDSLSDDAGSLLYVKYTKMSQRRE